MLFSFTGRPRTRSTVSATTPGSTPSETPDKVPVTCDKCGKSFTGQRYLKQHLQKHINDMRLCPTCGKSFKFKSSLSRHIKACSNKGYHDTKACSEKGSHDSAAQYIETVHVIAAADHVISTTSHVTTVAGHVMSQADDVITAVDHVMSEADHVMSETNHVIAAGDTVITTTEPEAIDPNNFNSMSSATVLSGLSRTVNVVTDTTGSILVLSSPTEVTAEGDDLVEYTAMLSGPWSRVIGSKKEL